MNRSDLYDLIRNGENSVLEFKRDDVRPEKLAIEMAALLNLEGGHILLGVEDDGIVRGLTRTAKEAEEWVMNIAQNNLQPSMIPLWQTLAMDDSEKLVGVIHLISDAPDKPYKARKGAAWVTFMRMGSTSREATREQEMRLYQQSGHIQYGRKPVSGASFHDFDPRRLVNYFRDLRQQNFPNERDVDSWTRLLVNTELMTEDRGRAMPTVAGLLLFGANPNRYLPQAGIHAAAYRGTVKEYAAQERAELRGAAVSLFSERQQQSGRNYPVMPMMFSGSDNAVDAGIIEQAVNFVRRNISSTATVDDGRRREFWDYPLGAVREAVVNAVAHRDYTIAVTDIEISVYSDRLEIISPGRLPNTVTVEKMRAGCRALRNEIIKDVLRDYCYIEASGLGVPREIVQGMHEHNGKEPDLIEEDDRFIVRLWK